MIRSLSGRISCTGRLPNVVTVSSAKISTTSARMTTANGISLDSNSHVSKHEKVNAWQSPGLAAYDFRSDTITTPNASMLSAIQNTTLFDDVFLEDPTTTSLEAHIATLTGHEAALLVMSGTMGNQVALRTHLGHPPHSVLCDKRGHIVNYEAGGIATLSGAMLLPILPSNGHHLTLEDVKANVILSDDIHACPTRVISLENTLDGTVMPLSEVKRIVEFARQHNIILHLDGARIWEAVAADAGSLTDYCSLFDSVSLCFSKGLGAPIGSIIVGKKDFIQRARHFRKMFGGGTRQAGVISAPARVAVDETFGRGPSGEGGKLRDVHKLARRIAATWEAKGGQLAKPVETNMVWLDINHEGLSIPQFMEISAQHGVSTRGGRLVVHYQISDEGVSRLEKVMDAVIAQRNGKV